jgi:hypothetical protein
MVDLLFGNHAGWFTAPALFGTVFFVIRLVAIGFGHGLDMEDAPGSASVPGDAHADSDHAFKVLSLQSITAFCMGFGWAGLASYKGAGWDASVSVIVGTAGGAALVWMLGVLLKGVYSLQSSGNVHAQDAVGRTGVVYLTIPASRAGRGQVRVSINDRQRIFDAVTDGGSIATGSPARVVAANGDRTLTVTSAQEHRPVSLEEVHG